MRVSPTQTESKAFPVTHPFSRETVASNSSSLTDNRVHEVESSTESQVGLSRFSLFLVLTASFMVVLDFSIVNVALPTIHLALGFGGDSVQWVVTAYAITFGGLLILGGRMADIIGRRVVFEIGLMIFAGASLAAGLTDDAGLLITARGLQGVGAALIAPASLSLITAHYAEGPQRTRALGLYGATASVGFVAGQVLGGVLVQYLSWRSIFLVNVPIGVGAVLVARYLLVRDRPRARVQNLDVAGGILSTIAVAALVIAVSEGPVLGWSHPLVIGAFVATMVAISAFVAVEKLHPNPLVDLALLRRPNLRTAGILSLILGVWTAGELVVLSLYLQQSLHDSALVTGLVIAPQGVVGFVTGAFSTQLVRRLGMRWLLVVSTATTGVGFLVLTHLPTAGPYSPLLAAVVLVGFGTVGTVIGTTVLAASGMNDTDQGLVGGVINTTRQIGAAIGVALLVAIADGDHVSTGTSTVSGDRTAMLTAAAVALAGSVVAWIGTSARKVVPLASSSTISEAVHPSCTTRQLSTPIRRTS